MTTFLIKRGKRARLNIAKAHIATYDRFGEISGAWCGRTGFDLSSNVPWGLKRCKDCIRKMQADS